MRRGPIDDFVRSLASDGTNVYVGTDSLAIGGVTGANHVARWDGSWHAMGANYFSTTSFIYSLAVDGPLVFAGGSFQNASGNPTSDQIVYWDGATWHPIGSNGSGNGPLSGEVDALATSAPASSRAGASPTPAPTRWPMPSRKHLSSNPTRRSGPQ